MLAERDGIGQDELDGARTRAREAVRDAVRAAMAAPDADPAVLVGDVPSAVFSAPLPAHAGRTLEEAR